MTELWTPNKVMPDKRKNDGGSYFDDELSSTEDRDAAIRRDAARLVDHLNKRPDHTVYVGSPEDREKMREVFNRWFMNGMLTRHPNIRIEYGVPDGAIRVAE